jgi:hypothetical protein
VTDTTRLRFETLEEAHADELCADLKDPMLYRFIPENVPASLDALRRNFGELAHGAPTASGESWLKHRFQPCAAGRGLRGDSHGTGAGTRRVDR